MIPDFLLQILEISISKFVKIGTNRVLWPAELLAHQNCQ